MAYEFIFKLLMNGHPPKEAINDSLYSSFIEQGKDVFLITKHNTSISSNAEFGICYSAIPEHSWEEDIVLFFDLQNSSSLVSIHSATREQREAIIEFIAKVFENAGFQILDIEEM